MSVILIDPNLVFIERRIFGPNHIARRVQYTMPVTWHTICGKYWRRDEVSELTTRESADIDPDTFVCRVCKRRATVGEVRIEETD